MRHFVQSLRVLPITLLYLLMLVLVWPSEEDEEDAPFTEIKPSLPGFAFQWIPVARYVCAVGVVPRDWEAPLPRLNIKPPEKGML